MPNSLTINLQNQAPGLDEKLTVILENHANKFADIRPEPGVLYIVSTPIGNLGEISFRALSILRNAEFVACEDTRHSGMLMKHYGIKAQLISYYSATEASKAERIVEMLKLGKSVALISDAGTPCISDPGSVLVSRCLSEGIEIKAVPGSSALIHALIMSGFRPDMFFFQGFLPVKKGRRATLEELKDKKMLIVIFESPFRFRKTLSELASVFGNKPASVSRELTKKFEETRRAGLKQLSEASIKEKGEFVIIINNSK